MRENSHHGPITGENTVIIIGRLGEEGVTPAGETGKDGAEGGEHVLTVYTVETAGSPMRMQSETHSQVITTTRTRNKTEDIETITNMSTKI